jgi:hypothetical protein
MSLHRRPVRGRRTGLAAAALAVAALTTLGASAPALAAKGGGGGKPAGGSTGSSSLTLATPLVYDANGDGQPNWGDTVTFDVSTTATDSPFVDLLCSQNGTTVYSATTGYFASYPWPWTKDMTLSSQMWTVGDASCTATLKALDGRKTYILKTLSFHASA